MKVYTVEEIIDNGNHVLHVFANKEVAATKLAEYESTRILKIEEWYANREQAVPLWAYTPHYELHEYSVEDLK